MLAFFCMMFTVTVTLVEDLDVWHAVGGNEASFEKYVVCFLTTIIIFAIRYSRDRQVFWLHSWR